MKCLGTARLKKNLSITNIFLVIFLAGMHSTATYKVLIDKIELFNKFLHDITQDVER